MEVESSSRIAIGKLQVGPGGWLGQLSVANRNIQPTRGERKPRVTMPG
jgi:hypothetical protein